MFLYLLLYLQQTNKHNCLEQEASTDPLFPTDEWTPIDKGEGGNALSRESLNSNTGEKRLGFFGGRGLN